MEDPRTSRCTEALRELDTMWQWRVLALGVVSAILLVVVCMLLSMPTSGILQASSPLRQHNYNFNEEDYYSTQHRLYSPRRILDNENPHSRSTPTSYPPPKSNVQKSPQCEHSQVSQHP